MIQDPNSIDPIELTATEWEQIARALRFRVASPVFLSNNGRAELRKILVKIGPEGSIAFHCGTTGC